MVNRLSKHNVNQKLLATDDVSYFQAGPPLQDLPDQLRTYAETLGLEPQKALFVLADLGLTDTEIGRYHSIPPRCISELRAFWDIFGTPELGVQ